MKTLKREFEQCLTDLLRELKACPPWLLAELIAGLMETGMSEDQAIRELAKMETLTRDLLEASRSIGEA